jgi:HAD superfamily hydrolase (TIGR01662 family)
VAIRGILFDLDGTLWHSETPPDWDHVTSLQYEAAASLLRDAGVEGEAAIQFIHSLWRVFGPRFQATDGELVETAYEIGRSAVLEVLAALGKEVSEAHARAIWAAVMQVPRRHYNTRPLPDTVATLTALADAGLRMAVVTNNPLPGWVIAGDLESMGVPAVFEAVLTSHDVGYRKPHPRIFEAALQQLELNPSEVAMVGDSLETDIQGARALGLLPIFMDESDHHPGSARCIRSLTELLRVLSEQS